MKKWSMIVLALTLFSSVSFANELKQMGLISIKDISVVNVSDGSYGLLLKDPVGQKGHDTVVTPGNLLMLLADSDREDALSLVPLFLQALSKQVKDGVELSLSPVRYVDNTARLSSFTGDKAEDSDVKLAGVTVRSYYQKQKPQDPSRVGLRSLGIAVE